MDINGKMPALAHKLQEFLSGKITKGGTSASVALIKDGELLAACASGEIAGRLVSVHDLYNIGSVSKVYCAMAVLKLAEQGKADLDTPVYTYLPRFKMRDSRYKQITLRMCLNHSSGLPGTDNKNAMCTKWLGEGYYDLLYDYFSKSTLKSDPGSRAVYCNDGFELAEMAAAEISGMSYTEFIKKYIAEPLGAHSTCTGESLTAGRVHVSENGKKNEYLTLLGAGGIVTDITDCARFGYLFIDPRNIFSRESVNEAVTGHNLSPLHDNASANMGLGWDYVAFKNGLAGLGNEIYLKSGGTTSFSSYLLVAKEHNLSAAISVSIDTKMNTVSVLCQMCVMALKELGIEISAAPSKKPDEVISAPLPPGYTEKISGKYYNYKNAYDVSFDNGALLVKKKMHDGWVNEIENAVFDGVCFNLDGARIIFQEHGGVIYLSQKTMTGNSPLGEKIPRGYFPEYSPAWLKRSGKKYIMRDGNPYDLTPGTFCGLTILPPENGEPLLFAMRESGDEMHYTPTLPENDNYTSMFLNGPCECSRDCYAPFLWEENGAEYIYFMGYTFVETGTLDIIKTGRVKSESAESNIAYLTKQGMKITYSAPDTVRLLLADDSFLVYYDSDSGTEPPITKEGFALFLNASAMDFYVIVNQGLLRNLHFLHCVQ